MDIVKSVVNSEVESNRTEKLLSVNVVLDHIGLGRSKVVKGVEMSSIARCHLNRKHLPIVRTACYLVVSYKNGVVLEVCMILVNCIVFQGGESNRKLEA